MKKIILLSLVLLLSNCTLNKVVQHHGVHNLEKKQLKLKINKSNKNDITKIIGPPSTKSSFNNDVYIYIERKTSSSKLTKLGKKKLLTNNILILEINDKGILVSKKFYDKNDMQNIKFEESTTTTDYSKRSFVYNFLSSLRQKIDDPLGKKRAKVNQK
jgi:outer membrane protein assembly factor BamE (lipoprotein component of BamABCDE complex)